MPSPHDAFFKQVLSHPERLASFLDRFLPRPLTERLALGQAQILPGSFVDETLRDRHTDLLVSVPLQQGEREPESRDATSHDADTTGLLVYTVIEHQSRSDPRMPQRLYTYLDRIWAAFEREHPSTTTLPPIVPIVVFQGEGDRSTWDAPTRLHGAIAWGGTEAALTPYVPDLGYVLVDLTTLDEALGHDALALAMRTMKWMRHEAFIHEVFRAFRHDAAAVTLVFSDLPLLKAFLHYVHHARHLDDARHFIALLRDEVVGNPGEEAMQVIETAAQTLFRQGKEEGRAEGRQEGRQEARTEVQTEILTRLLRLRFGPLTESTEKRIASGTTPQREEWLGRVITAATLDDVFRP